VVLLGGEPLLHPDWDNLILLAADQGLKVALISNGLCVTESIARKLHALPLSHVGISLDGASDQCHDRLRGRMGARKKAWRALENLLAASVPTTVITTVNQINVQELEAMREQLVDKQVVWQLQVANGRGARFSETWMLPQRAILDVAHFIEQTRRMVPKERLAIGGGHTIGYHSTTVNDYSIKDAWLGCPGGISAMGICSDGAVKGCLSMHESEVVGSIVQTSLRDLWQRPHFFAHRRTTQPGRLEGACGRCPHGATCRAGCPEMARTGSGDVWDNPFCLRRIELLNSHFEKVR
jgi:radical SAM protein with 4Fe4S-binding SPASM domain